MANPKRRASKARKRRRRSHHALNSPTLGECSNCSQPKKPHAVCGNCGFYKNGKVAEIGERGRILVHGDK